MKKEFDKLGYVLSTALEVQYCYKMLSVLKDLGHYNLYMFVHKCIYTFRDSEFELEVTASIGNILQGEEDTLDIAGSLYSLAFKIRSEIQDIGLLDEDHVEFFGMRMDNVVVRILRAQQE